jgi:hypothetical protein
MKAVHVRPLRELAPSSNSLAVPSGAAAAIPTTVAPERVILRLRDASPHG